MQAYSSLAEGASARRAACVQVITGREGSNRSPLSVFLLLLRKQLESADRLREQRALVVARLGFAEGGGFAAVEDLAFGRHPVAEAAFHEADAQVDRQHAADYAIVPAHCPAHDEVEH